VTDPFRYGHTEESLPGGNQTAGVVRVADTVRRPAQPWSPAIRELLDHLDATVPGIAPRSLGQDDLGRDVFSFVEGTTGHYPLDAAMRSDDALVEAARLLRRYHDATVTLAHRSDLPWGYLDPSPDRREVICHNDVAPCNILYRDGKPATLIDFDHAGPGPRVRDLAYAVYRFAPLASDASCRTFGWDTPPDRIRRARRFVEAYGMDADAELIPTVMRRVRDLRDGILALVLADPDRVRTHIREDHVGAYNGDLLWIATHRSALQRLLGSMPPR